MDAPINQSKWVEAQSKVCKGELVLLRRVHECVKAYKDIYSPDRFFRWNHHLADFLMEKKFDFYDELSKLPTDRAPIIHFGRRSFQHPNYKGDIVDWKGYGPENFAFWDKKIPRKIVGIGAMDENWGWLSTNFLNRYQLNDLVS